MFQRGNTFENSFNFDCNYKQPRANHVLIMCLFFRNQTMTLSRGASGLWSGSRVDFFPLTFCSNKTGLANHQTLVPPFPLNQTTPELQKIVCCMSKKKTLHPYRNENLYL